MQKRDEDKRNASIHVFLYSAYVFVCVSFIENMKISGWCRFFWLNTFFFNLQMSKKRKETRHVNGTMRPWSRLCRRCKGAGSLQDRQPRSLESQGPPWITDSVDGWRLIPSIAKSSSLMLKMRILCWSSVFTQPAKGFHSQRLELLPMLWQFTTRVILTNQKLYKTPSQHLFLGSCCFRRKRALPIEDPLASNSDPSTSALCSPTSVSHSPSVLEGKVLLFVFIEKEFSFTFGIHLHPSFFFNITS